MYIYIQGTNVLNSITLLNIRYFVHIFYISINIRILSINKLGIVQGLKVGKERWLA